MVGAQAPNCGTFTYVLEKVTQHYCTFQPVNSGQRRCEPVDWLTISWDPGANRLRLYIDYKYSNMK
jgi:hypothetical protein